MASDRPFYYFFLLEAETPFLCFCNKGAMDHTVKM
jgi:hypothetical protein